MKVLTIGRLKKLNSNNISVKRILEYIPSISKSIKILKELEEINSDIEKQKIWLENYYDFYYETLLIFQVDFYDWIDFKSETLIKIDNNYSTPKVPFKPMLDLFEIYSKLENDLTPNETKDSNGKKDYYDQD
ncbi:MAG TPA: hypothetical protein PK006_10155 [Saprospiraceae bacterium]|nr:hypothetical protein [Saprospiraceae bacterium]